MRSKLALFAAILGALETVIACLQLPVDGTDCAKRSAGIWMEIPYKD